MRRGWLVSDLATHAHSAHPPGFAHQFEDIEQQRDAGRLGMWAFLVTEILFFGGMFTAYIVYRSLHYPAFEIGSHLLEVKFGATNTAVLIFSSLTMAMAIHSAQTGKSKQTVITWLILTMILGATFLGLKLRFEWYEDYVKHIVPGAYFGFENRWGPLGGQVEMFMCFYFFMTGLHAIHMVIGLGILTVLVIMTAKGKFSSEYYAPLEISGLYWHFVDIVWIFLFPLLYLIGGRYIPH
jgi:cytochrome c oxidase subunit III